MKERFYVAEILILIKVWKMHGYDDVYGAFMAILGHTSNKEDEEQPVAVGWETGAATQMVSSHFPAAAKQRCSHRRRPKEHRTGAVSSKVDCQARDARAVWNVLVHFSRGGKRGCDVFYKK